MIDFFGSGYDGAEPMGLIPRLEEVRYDVRKLVYVDKSGRPSSSVAYDVFRRLQRRRLMSFMRGDLEGALFAALPKSVEVRVNVTLQEIVEESTGVRVTLSDGVHEGADLLVGADGVHSRVRELLFGQEQPFLRYLGFHTPAYIFQDQRISEESIVISPTSRFPDETSVSMPLASTESLPSSFIVRQVRRSPVLPARNFGEPMARLAGSFHPRSRIAMNRPTSTMTRSCKLKWKDGAEAARR